MMDAMLLRYMHYLLFKYSPGIYYPMQMNVWKSSRNPIELEVIHGDGNQEKFDIEHGLKLIRGIVDETNSPYALLILIFEEQGQHQTMIVVYKNNDGAIGFSWLDTEKSIRADIRKLIHGTLARANIVTHGHTPLAINCRSLPEDYPEVLQSCRDVAVPRAGMCVSLCALCLFHLYVRQYSVRQIAVMWRTTKVQIITEALSLVTACLLQLSMDSYAQTLQEHVEIMDRVEEMRRKHDDLERGRDLKYAQRLAEDAVEIMNTVNFTSKDLHEEKYARLLPSRILPPPPPNRKKK